MPIKPERRARRPLEWPVIRAAILERAGQRCEWPGCGVANQRHHIVNAYMTRKARGNNLELEL